MESGHAGTRWGAGMLLAVSCASSAVAACCPEAFPTTAASWTGGSLPSPAWIGADADGGVFLTAPWNGALALFVSLDDGASWRAPVEIVPAPDFASSAAAVDGTGALLIAYQGSTGLFFVRSEDQGRTSSVPALVSASSSVSLRSLAVGASGVVTIIAIEEEPAGSQEFFVSVAASRDGGLSWGALQRISDLPTASLSGIPSAAVADQTIVVAWNDSRDGMTRIYADRSSDGGMSWGPDQAVNPRRAPAREVHVATTGDGYFQVGYMVQPDEHHVNVSSDDGATWPATDITLSSGDGTGALSGRLTLLAGAAGRVYVVALRSDLAPTPLFHRSDDHGLPGTWSATPISPGGMGWHAFMLHEGPPGTVTLVHDDYREDDATCPESECESIYLDRSCDFGTTWLPAEIRLDEDAAPPATNHSEDPSLAVSPRGRIHVAWSEAGGAPDFRLRYRGLELPSVVRGLELSGLLLVSRVPGAVRLTWTDGTTDATGYGVYGGAIGTWYSHAPVACHVERLPAAAPSTTRDVAWPAVDTYYLVAPADCGSEGSVGADSFGAPRPQSPAGPPCGPMP